MIHLLCIGSILLVMSYHDFTTLEVPHRCVLLLTYLMILFNPWTIEGGLRFLMIGFFCLVLYVLDLLGSTDVKVLLLLNQIDWLFWGLLGITMIPMRYQKRKPMIPFITIAWISTISLRVVTG